MKRQLLKHVRAIPALVRWIMQYIRLAVTVSLERSPCKGHMPSGSLVTSACDLMILTFSEVNKLCSGRDLVLCAKD